MSMGSSCIAPVTMLDSLVVPASCACGCGATRRTRGSQRRLVDRRRRPLAIFMLRWAAECLLVGFCIGPRQVCSQSTPFSVLPFRDPGQCERMQCLSVSGATCREHLLGYYLMEKGCPAGQICTNCIYGNTTEQTDCYCENPPYALEATYGQECNLGKYCAEGEGICFRPCYTYLHSTLCPSGHCSWNKLTGACDAKPSDSTVIMWLNTQIGTVQEQAAEIVSDAQASVFPINFHTFRSSTEGYRINGVRLSNITELEHVFLKLDMDRDGYLNQQEFGGIPSVLAQLEAVVNEQLAEQIAAAGAAPSSAATSSGSVYSAARRLQANAMEDAERSEDARRRLQDGVVTPQICNAQGLYYCSFDVTCKADCEACGWKTATDKAFATCVIPTPAACFADGGKVYCPSDELCHPPGNCEACFDRPIVDHSQHLCLALWWAPEPLQEWKNWVCRDRNKVGMPCRHDQDCIYGMKRCLNGECQPFQPYNPNQTCATDMDCPHLSYYCPSDPTGGENIYWVNYCRRQREEGSTCAEDRECLPDLRCNLGEAQPRCRRYFSLPIGTPASDDTFCSYGWRDANAKCAPPAKSKQAGRSCDTDASCTTTDQTGRSGSCVCKAWWAEDDSRYCMPVSGDYERHQESLRNYIWFRVKNCGFHWTEEECLTVFGAQAMKLKLKYECDTQQLSGGPYLPPTDCGIDPNDSRFFDACAALDALQQSSGSTSAGTASSDRRLASAPTPRRLASMLASRPLPEGTGGSSLTGGPAS